MLTMVTKGNRCTNEEECLRLNDEVDGGKNIFSQVRRNGMHFGVVLP